MKSVREGLSIRLKAALAGREGSASGSRSVPMGGAGIYGVRSEELAEGYVRRYPCREPAGVCVRQTRRRALNVLRERHGSMSLSRVEPRMNSSLGRDLSAGFHFAPPDVCRPRGVRPSCSAQLCFLEDGSCGRTVRRKSMPRRTFAGGAGRGGIEPHSEDRKGRKDRKTGRQERQVR